MIDGITALIRAVLAEQPQICKALLENGADADVISDEGLTPLMLAVDADNLEVCKLLVAKQRTTK